MPRRLDLARTHCRHFPGAFEAEFLRRLRAAPEIRAAAPADTMLLDVGIRIHDVERRRQVPQSSAEWDPYEQPGAWAAALGNVFAAWLDDGSAWSWERTHCDLTRRGQKFTLCVATGGSDAESEDGPVLSAAVGRAPGVRPIPWGPVAAVWMSWQLWHVWADDAIEKGVGLSLLDLALNHRARLRVLLHPAPRTPEALDYLQGFMRLRVKAHHDPGPPIASIAFPWSGWGAWKTVDPPRFTWLRP
jgi:hypothetical protein